MNSSSNIYIYITIKFIVVGLTLIDLRRRGKIDRLGICGTNGKKFPDIRKHMQQAIGDVYKEMNLTMDWWLVHINSQIDFHN